LNRGWEGRLRWRPVRRISVQSGYAYLRSTNLPPYIPRHKLNYSVEIDTGRAFLYFGGVTVGRRWADTRRSSELDGYSAPTLKCTVPFRERYTVFFVVDNLFDQRYEVVTGYPMPGLNAAGGFTLRF